MRGNVARIVGNAIQLLWPARRHREALLDLGERKRWSAAAETRALRTFVAWLDSGRFLDAITGSGPRVRPHSAPSRPLDARALVDPAGWIVREPGPRTAGVSTHRSALAPLLDVEAKTLSNSLVRGRFHARRWDHIWLAALARALDAPAEPCFVYHTRTRAGLALAMERLDAHVRAGVPDAWDALVVFTLLALYQRRRPTSEARGNRGRTASRRRTPKPIAQFAGRVGSMSQMKHLVSAAVAAVAAHREPARAMVVLALEWAFTDAHLLVHPARRSRSARAPGRARDERALRRLSDLLHEPGVSRLLGSEDRALYDYRLGRIAGYALGVPRERPAEAIRAHPHVLLAERVSSERASGPRAGIEDRAELMRLLDQDAPGGLMVAPQVRAVLALEERLR